MIQCKTYPVSKDSSKISVDERHVACSGDGSTLFVAQGKELIVFELIDGEGKQELERTFSVKAPGEIAEVSCGGGEPLATVRHSDGAEILRLVGQRLETVTRLPDLPRQVLPTSREVFVLTAAGPGRAPEILRLDPGSGAVENSVTVSAGVARLRAAPGRAVLALNPGRRQVSRVDLGDPECRPGGSGRPDSGNPDREPEAPCHCKATPCCCPDSRDPHSPRPTPPRRPPRDFCEEGDDGIQDDCRVYTVAGFSIICRDLCHPDRDPCRRRMHGRIDRLELVGPTLFAVTRGGRTAEALDPKSLSVRGESALAGPSALPLAAPAAGRLLSVATDLSQVVAIEALPALPAELDFQAEVSEKVVEGTDSLGGPVGPTFDVGDTSVLIVPIVHPGQNYSGPAGNDAYRDALDTLLEPAGSAAAADAPLAKVRRYYDEQSAGQQPLSFTTFGANTPAYYSGGPIEIDGALESYFYPPFVPGGLFAGVGSGPGPFDVRMRGNATLEITAFSGVNAGNGSANAFNFTLEFPALILRLDLGGGRTISIPTSGPDWPLNYDDSGGVPRSLTLEPSNLPDDVEIVFNNAGGEFEAEVSALQTALQTMLEASSAAGDFEEIEVRWGRRPGEQLGQLYVLFRFAAGGDTPLITNFSGSSVVEAFFGLEPGDAAGFRGSALPSLAGMGTDIETEEDGLSDYLTIVMRLAEVAVADNHNVQDPILGSARVEISADGTGYATTLSLSNTHGRSPARIEPGAATGNDPLGLADGSHEEGSDISYDQRNTMKDKVAFFEMLYGRLTAAVQADLGGQPADGWSGFADFLEGFDTVYVFPVDAPPPAQPGAWSVDLPPVSSGKRAFVAGLGEAISDPGGIGDPVDARWGLNFQSFDAGGALESNTRTLAHELGHTLGLADQYSSDKFDPTLDYLGSLDLMGNSGADWPHFCAYHKIALGWLGESARIVISPPQQSTEERQFILVPSEWWRDNLVEPARDAFTDAESLDVGAVALCDLGGDGGVLGTIEARAAGAEFSSDLAPSGAAGRVTALNVLDYGVSGRYGQVIADANDVPQSVLDGLLRFRRRIHRLAGNLQSGDIFDFADAPGFPFDGLTVMVGQQSSISVDGTTVPVYLCSLSWTPGLAADVGFADNDEEWRSSDIAIDYIGEDPENPESGPDSWPDGQPVGVGETVVIPPTGEEPHRVLVRVRNFGQQAASKVQVNLYLRDPGGGGELDGDEPYAVETIAELLPESDAGPMVLEFPWNVPAGQEPHVCWRAEIGEFEIGDGGSSQVVVTDASVTNNWAQQNIFEADVTFASPPEPLESRFSVTNNGPFVETARLVPEGLPRGVTLRIRPRELRVPAYSRRTFTLRFEFDEELTRDDCRREMDVLLRCLRLEEHYEEPWGASLFKIRLKRRTECAVQGTWFGNALDLSGTIDPPISVGRVSLRLDFENGEAARWIAADLNPGGVFDADFDTSGIDHGGRVVVAARYRGTDLFAPSTSDPVEIHQILPAG